MASNLIAISTSPTFPRAGTYKQDTALLLFCCSDLGFTKLQFKFYNFLKEFNSGSSIDFY